MIKFMKLHPNAIIPKTQREGDAGFDICALEGGRVYGDEHAIFSTGIAVSIPDGYVGLIKPRSGLAVKYAVDTLAGVIDSSYRGEIKVIVTSHDTYMEVEFNEGDRIAQLVVVPCMTESCEVDSLGDTERGINGFGSTGL